MKGDSATDLDILRADNGRLMCENEQLRQQIHDQRGALRALNIQNRQMRAELEQRRTCEDRFSAMRALLRAARTVSYATGYVYDGRIHVRHGREFQDGIVCLRSAVMSLDKLMERSHEHFVGIWPPVEIPPEETHDTPPAEAAQPGEGDDGQRTT